VVEEEGERIIAGEVLTMGQADPDQIQAQDVDEGQRCQVLDYAGARLLTEGQTEAAREVLTACLRLNADCLERHSPRSISPRRSLLCTDHLSTALHNELNG
jgi:hypothetical protein